MIGVRGISFGPHVSDIAVTDESVASVTADKIIRIPENAAVVICNKAVGLYEVEQLAARSA